RVINGFQDKTRENERANSMTRGIFELDSRIETLGKTIEKRKDKYDDQLCGLLKTHGIFTRDLVGDDGVAAAFYLFKNFTFFEFQLEMVPIITIAVKKNELPKNEDYAAFVDRL